MQPGGMKFMLTKTDKRELWKTESIPVTQFFTLLFNKFVFINIF